LNNSQEKTNRIFSRSSKMRMMWSSSLNRRRRRRGLLIINMKNQFRKTTQIKV